MGVKRLEGGGADPQIGSANKLLPELDKRISIGGLAELIYNVPVWGNFPGRKLQKPNP